MLFKLDQFRKFRDAHVPKHQFETTSLLYGLTILHSKTWGLMFFSTARYCGSYGECTTSSGEEIWISESTLLFNISKPIGSMGLVYLPLFAQVNFPNMDPMQKKLQKLTLFEELHHLPKLFMGKIQRFIPDKLVMHQNQISSNLLWATETYMKLINHCSQKKGEETFRVANRLKHSNVFFLTKKDNVLLLFHPQDQC